MIFIAHLSSCFSDEFESLDQLFSVIISANDIEEAIEKMKDEIHFQKESSGLFNNVECIYLECLVQVNQWPGDAAVIWNDIRSPFDRTSSPHSVVDGIELVAHDLKLQKYLDPHSKSGFDEVVPLVCFESSSGDMEESASHKSNSAVNPSNPHGIVFHYGHD